MFHSPEFEKFLSRDKSENIFNESECDANIKDKMWDVIKEDSNLCIRMGKCLLKNQDFHYYENTSDPNDFYAPLTTVAAGKSFSVYKSNYSDRRTKFTEENKEMFYLVLYNRFLYF